MAWAADDTEELRTCGTLRGMLPGWQCRAGRQTLHQAHLQPGHPSSSRLRHSPCLKVQQALTGVGPAGTSAAGKDAFAWARAGPGHCRWQRCGQRPRGELSACKRSVGRIVHRVCVIRFPCNAYNHVDINTAQEQARRHQKPSASALPNLGSFEKTYLRYCKLTSVAGCRPLFP